MSFNPQYKYLNKFFVVGTVTELREQKRQDESTFGVEFVVNTGSPSGIARVRIPNNKNVPDAYGAAQSEFAGGTPRIAFGLTQDWLRLGEREYNGRTYRDFTQFAFPRLALQSEQSRVAGKLIGTLTSKQVVDDHYVVVLEVYETNKDGSIATDNLGNERVTHFTLTARGEEANEIHTTPEGSNVECSVRLHNEVIRDDFGDITDSTNEACVEKFKVLIAASGVPSFGVGVATPSFGAQQPTAPTFGTSTPASVFPATTTTAPTTTGAPFGGAPLPFPNAGNGQAAPFGGFGGAQG
jgi:hypothetical protein